MGKKSKKKKEQEAAAEKRVRASEVLKDFKLDGDAWKDESAGYINVLFYENDRSCILATAAFVDDLLEELIRSKLKKLSGIGRDDLDFLLTKRPLPPIGSFGVRITMSRALGIITPDTRNLLHLVQDVRNNLAHSWGDIWLRETDIMPFKQQMTREQWDLVCEFAGQTPENRVIELDEKFHLLLAQLSLPRRQFIGIAVYISAQLGRDHSEEPRPLVPDYAKYLSDDAATSAANMQDSRDSTESEGQSS